MQHLHSPPSLRCAAGGSQLRELPEAGARRAYYRLKNPHGRGPQVPEGNCFQHCRPSSLSTKAGRHKIVHTIALRRTGTRVGFLLVLSKACLGIKKQFSTTLAPKTSQLKGNSIET